MKMRLFWLLHKLRIRRLYCPCGRTPLLKANIVAWICTEQCLKKHGHHNGWGIAPHKYDLDRLIAKGWLKSAAKRRPLAEEEARLLNE